MPAATEKPGRPAVATAAHDCTPLPHKLRLTLGASSILHVLHSKLHGGGDEETRESKDGGQRKRKLERAIEQNKNKSQADFHSANSIKKKKKVPH